MCYVFYVMCYLLMNVTKKDLPKSQVELIVNLSVNEFKPFIQRAIAKISKEVKIDGFRPGKVPYEILKSKIGEMTIMEEAANLAINGTVDKALNDNIKETTVGNPQIAVIKLAPENPFEYKATLVLLPKIELGGYKKLEVKKDSLKIEDKEIEKMLKQLQEMRVTESIVKRSAKDGDKVIISIEMFLDKVPVDGGQTRETTILLGKDYIVPGLDKKIIGIKKDEKKEFTLPYPKEHYMKNLAGKMVEFVVKAKEIYERKLPAIDDTFAVTLGLNSLENLKENIKKNIKAEKEQQIKQKAEIEIIDKIIEKTKFSEIPEILVNNEVNSLMKELEYNVQSQGGKFEDYLASIKKTKDQLTLDWLPQALKRVKGSLLIREIALTEKIDATEQEIAKRQAELLKQYKGQPDIENKIQAAEYKNYLRNIILNEKVMEKLREWNIE